MKFQLILFVTFILMTNCILYLICSVRVNYIYVHIYRTYTRPMYRGHIFHYIYIHINFLLFDVCLIFFYYYAIVVVRLIVFYPQRNYSALITFLNIQTINSFVLILEYIFLFALSISTIILFVHEYKYHSLL